MYINNKNKKADKPRSDPGLSLPGKVIPDGGVSIPGRQFPVTDPVQQGIPGGKTYLNVKGSEQN